MDSKPEDQTTETPIATLNTGQGDAPSGSSSTQPLRDNPPMVGIIAVIFGVISIFMWSIIFVPLALVLGIVALFSGQIGWGILAIILSVIGVITSPMLLMMLGMGALMAYFGMALPM